MKVPSLIAVALLASTAARAAPLPYDVTPDLRRVPVPPVDPATQPATVVRNIILLDGRGGAAMPNAAILIRGTRIVAAGPEASIAIPAGAAQVDGHGLYALPGLIDLHVHVTSQRGTDAGRYGDSDSAAAIRATALTGDLVRAGITSVRDPGTVGDVALRIKQAAARHMIPSPRVFWCGSIIATTGGHGDEITSTGSGRAKADDNSGRTKIADGPWEWREAVRSQMRRMTDWIKVSAPFAREEIDAGIDEAHREHMRVAIDSFGEYTLWAIEAGVDSVEHTLDVQPTQIALMAKHHTALVPTLGAFNNLITGGYPSAAIPSGGFFYTHSRRFAIDHAQNLATVKRARDAGIRIGVGTDIPFDTEVRYPAAYFQELRYLRDAGLSNSEVLASATRIGADILGMGDMLGTIEPGKLADIILVDGDPRQDITRLEHVDSVIADGRLIAR